MTQEYTIWVENKAYPVVVSDEREALLAAKAAGRVFVALYPEEISEGEQGSEILWDAEYLAAPDAICPEYLERIVRRHIGLPWIIAETDRLTIREFTSDDITQMPEEPDTWYTEEERTADRIFYDKDKLEAYIKSQYRFYEYGIWAVVRKADGMIVGKAGLTNPEEPVQKLSENKITQEEEEYLELGYHIFRPYRRQGYAEEACRAILHYAKEELCCSVCARVANENAASIRLLQKLGVDRVGAFF